MSGGLTIATGFEPPYYAVVFTSTLRDPADGYAETAARMLELAATQPGFLGVESVREKDLGITVSYWATLEAVAQWKRVAEHQAAQEKGRARWYLQYKIRVARVERDYGFESEA